MSANDGWNDAPWQPAAPQSLHAAVRQIESGGNPNAVSPVGAQGAMQVMPATQRDPGYGVRPAANTTPQELERVGHDYLDALYRHYGGDEQKVLAAYNAGPGRVDKGGVLPAETRAYVPKVLAARQALEGQAQQPGQAAQATTGNDWNDAPWNPPGAVDSERASTTPTAPPRAITSTWQAQPEEGTEVYKGLGGSLKGIGQAAIYGLARGGESLSNSINNVFINPFVKLFGGDGLESHGAESIKPAEPVTPQGRSDWFQKGLMTGAQWATEWAPYALGGEAFKGAQLVEKLPQALQGITRTVLGKTPENAMQAMKNLGGQLVSAFSAGNWGTDISHMAEQSAKALGFKGDVAKDVGMFLGATAVPTVTGKAFDLAFSAVPRLISRLGSSAGREATASKIVDEEIQKIYAADPQAKQNLQEAMGLQKRIQSNLPPGQAASLDIPRASGSEYMAGRKAQVQAENPANLMQGAREAQALRETGQASLDAALPKQSTFPAQLSKAQQTEYARTNERIGALDKEIQGIASKLDVAAPEAARDALAVARQKHFEATYAQSNKNYENFVNTGMKEGVKIDIAPIRDDLARLYAKDASIKIPGLKKEAPSKILDASGKPVQSASSSGPAATIDVKTWQKIDQDLAARIRDTYRGEPSSKVFDERQRLQALKDHLEQGMTQTSGKTKQAFDEARSFYRSQIVNRFYEGVGAQLAEKDRFDRVPDAYNNVAKLIKDKDAAKDYLNIFGNDKKAHEALRLGLFDEFTRANIKDGRIDVRAASKWLDRNRERLQYFPEIRKELGQATQSTDAFFKQRAEIMAHRTELDKGLVSRMLKTDYPEKELAKALDNPQALQDLVTRVKADPGLAKATAREVADQVLKREAPQQYMKENERTLKPLLDSLGAGTFDRIRDHAHWNEIVERVKIPATATIRGAQDALEQATGTTVKGAINLVNPKSIGSKFDRFMNFGNKFVLTIVQKDKERLERAALYDTDLRDAIRTLEQHGPTKQNVSRLQTQLLQNGIKAGTLMTITGAPDFYRKGEERPGQRSPASTAPSAPLSNLPPLR